MTIAVIVVLFITHMGALFVGVFLGATRNQERNDIDE